MELKYYFEILAKNIKKFRLEKGISVKELSKLSGISMSYLYKIESAKAKGMLLSHLDLISDALKVKVFELLKEN